MGREYINASGAEVKPDVGGDTVTILEMRAPLFAAKRIRLSDGHIQSYDEAKHFKVHEQTVDGIDTLAALLTRVEKSSRCCLIRGGPRAGIDRANAVRRLRARAANGHDEEPATFDAAARYWIPLDFDGVEIPQGLSPLTDPEAAVRVLVGRLRREFHGVTCWWQHTAGAGFKPGIRMRLFFWGSRPTTDEELKAWLPEKVVDHSLFHPIQPIYTANPVFEGGPDPVPRRSGVLRGERDTVAVPDEIEANEEEEDTRRLGYAGWRALIGDHEGGKGFNRPIKWAIAAWVGKHGANKPTTWLLADIERAIRAADASKHDADYIEEKVRQIDGIIEWTVDREAQKPKKQKQGQAEEVAEIAATATTLFHNPEEDAYVDLERDGHRETYPVRSKAFKQWLSFEYYRKHNKPPASDAIEQALVLTEGIARFEAPEREVYVRVARVDGRIYLDLADAAWRAVEIDAQGWRIVERPPVRFRRTATMLALPDPARGGDIKDLRPFLNIDNDDDFVMAVAWDLAAVGGAGPYPILALHGTNGAVKTSTGRRLRAVFDPSTLQGRGLPRSDRDLAIAAHNAHCLHFENISKIPDWLSDTFCRLATGGGFATRQLYQDTDEQTFRGLRPLVLDGIENFVERADLADRAIKLELGDMPDDKRRAESELAAKWAAAHPAILGALLDAAAHGLRELPETRLERLPRMADFALWIAACEGALWERGTFQRVYDANRGDMLRDTVDADLVAGRVTWFMREKPWNALRFPNAAGKMPPETDHWVGTADKLLELLEFGLDPKVKIDQKWPKNARALSQRLRRLDKGLGAVGIEVKYDDAKTNGVRTLQLLPKV